MTNYNQTTLNKNYYPKNFLEGYLQWGYVKSLLSEVKQRLIGTTRTLKAIIIVLKRRR
jgi:hypothetical protein